MKCPAISYVSSWSNVIFFSLRAITELTHVVRKPNVCLIMHFYNVTLMEQQEVWQYLIQPLTIKLSHNLPIWSIIKKQLLEHLSYITKAGILSSLKQVPKSLIQNKTKTSVILLLKHYYIFSAVQPFWHHGPVKKLFNDY